jgi:ribose 5-phosphate isomerase B
MLKAAGHQTHDLGCPSEGTADYPDYALLVADEVASGRADLGILVCSSGIGMSIAANKVPGIRAALCCSELMAARSRQHNDANVLCLGAETVSAEQAELITKTWLESGFEAGRHTRRLEKIRRAERQC